MKRLIIYIILTQLVLIVYAKVLIINKTKKASSCRNDTYRSKCANKTKKVLSSSRYDNPDLIRDRLRKIITKPEMPSTWSDRHKQRYHPSWMDYCDPYHCNDYHRRACGLNRKNMKFKWFQSVCHMILNNQCSDFRGNLKYDVIATKHCTAYVMFLRSRCPHYTECDDHKLYPLCAFSSRDGHVVLFENKCFMDAINCLNSTLQEYEEVKMAICEKALYYDFEPEVREVEPPMNEGILVNLGKI